MSGVKFVMLIWRRPGLSHGEFRDYYEERHALLGAGILPASADYRRNFPVWDGADAAALGGFDVATEVWHADQAAFDRQIAARQVEPFKARLDTDEAMFMDRASKVFVMLDERRLGDTRLAPARAKLMRFVRAPQGMATADFRAAVEGLAHEALPSVIDYRCNFVTGKTPAGATPAFDAIEEIWLGEGATPGAWPTVDGAVAWTVPMDERGLPGAGSMAPLVGAA